MSKKSGIKLGHQMREFRPKVQDLDESVSEVLLVYREPTSKERIDYMTRATAIDMTKNPSEGLRVAAELQQEYGLMVLKRVEGVEGPDGMEPMQAVKEFGYELLRALCDRVFNVGRAVGEEAISGKVVSPSG